MNEEVDILYCIAWSYFDGSGSGVATASLSKSIAENNLELLRQLGDPSRTFSLVEVPCVLGKPDGPYFVAVDKGHGEDHTAVAVVTKRHEVFHFVGMQTERRR